MIFLRTSIYAFMHTYILIYSMHLAAEPLRGAVYMPRSCHVSFHSSVLSYKSISSVWRLQAPTSSPACAPICFLHSHPFGCEPSVTVALICTNLTSDDVSIYVIAIWDIALSCEISIQVFSQFLSRIIPTCIPLICRSYLQIQDRSPL